MSYLASRGFTPATISHFGLEEHDDGSVTIPYHSALGERDYSRVRIRTGDGVGAKYLSPQGRGQHLFNVEDTARERVYLTEGEFDCITLWQLASSHALGSESSRWGAVGLPGVQSFKPAWRWLFCHPLQVRIVFDGDEAGRTGARRVAGLIGSVCEDTEIIELPEEEDVNSLWLKDPQQLRGLLGLTTLDTAGAGGVGT